MDDQNNDIIYLNNAATGWPRAPGVVDAMSKALTVPPTLAGRVAGSGDDIRSECRTRLAALMKVSDPTRIVLATHATHALNIAIRGLDLQRGSHVVTTVTEHNSVLRPLNHLKMERDLRITIVGLDENGAIDTEAFKAALAKKPSLVAINHASNVTGRIADVGPLLAMAKDAGAVTLLDASQSLGHIPVFPEILQADLVAFTCHKGLHGPPGVGGLYVAPHIELAQVLVGGTGVRSDLEFHPAEMPTRLEAGTPNVAALAGLVAALQWHEANAQQLQLREKELSRHLHHGLYNIPEVEVFGVGKENEQLGIASVRLRGWTVEEAGYVLQESFGILCRTGLHCAPLVHAAIGTHPIGTIRFSISPFNSDIDINRALQAVESLTLCTSSQ